MIFVFENFVTMVTCFSPCGTQHDVEKKTWPVGHFQHYRLYTNIYYAQSLWGFQSSMNGRDMEMCGLPNGIWKRPETEMAFTFVVPVTKNNN